MNPEVYRRMAEVEAAHWWFRARRTIISGLIARVGLSEGIRILDAGCGTGGNLAMLVRHGEVVGMESDAGARSTAAATGLAPVVPGRLPDQVPFEDGRFDLIVLLDVLEHVNDDRGALSALARLLRPGGHLVITVPAFPFLWSRHDEAHHHFRRYRLGDLTDKVRDSGLDALYASHFNTLLFPLIATARLADRLRPAQSRAYGDLAMPPAPVNRTLHAIFASERHLVGRLRLPFGVSAVLLARKPL